MNPQGRYTREPDIPGPTSVPQTPEQMQAEIRRLQQNIHDAELWRKLVTSDLWPQLKEFWAKWRVRFYEQNQLLSPFADAKTAARIERNNGRIDMLRAFFAEPERLLAEASTGGWRDKLTTLYSKLTGGKQ